MSATTYFANYTIGPDAYDAVPQVCKLYGSRALLIGGPKAMEAAAPALRQALEGSGLEIVAQEVFGTDCTVSRMEALAALAKERGAEMVFGMGGGKALDTAKGAAWRAGLPVFTFPTIAATCAGTTALSVVYREDGSFDHFDYFDRPAIHCFIHTGVIAAAPACYLRAGMGDTLGKYYECQFSSRGESLPHSSALARSISGMCCFPLLEHGAAAMADCQANRVTPELEEADLANVVSTGLVSLLVDENYNGAVAHSVYYGLVLLPGFEEAYLHGDVVAYGVLVQLALDGQTDEMKKIRRLMDDLGIPATLGQMNVPLDRSVLEPVLTEAVHSPDMEHIPYPVTEDMLFEAMQRVEAL